MDRVLLDLARDIGDPESADRIIAALILNAEPGTAWPGAGAAARDRQSRRSRRRAVHRRNSVGTAQVGITLGLATFLVVFAPIFIHPYRGSTGQLMLAIVVGLFAAAFAVMRKLSTPARVLPFLPRADAGLTERDYAVIAALSAPNGDPPGVRP
jgi:hypothetical protein